MVVLLYFSKPSPAYDINGDISHIMDSFSSSVTMFWGYNNVALTCVNHRFDWFDINLVATIGESATSVTPKK